MNYWTLEMGGHCRTGLEDNVRWDKDTLAKSNAQLVARVASLCGEYERPVASAAQARELLHLPPRPPSNLSRVADCAQHLHHFPQPVPPLANNQPASKVSICGLSACVNADTSLRTLCHSSEGS